MEPNDIPVTPEEDEAWWEHGRRRGYFPYPIMVDPTLPPDMLRIAPARKAAAHEAAAHEAAKSYLPRGLRWIVRRPRVLRVLYRLRPEWRPEVTVGTDLDTQVVMIRHRLGHYIIVETRR